MPSDPHRRLLTLEEARRALAEVSVEVTRTERLSLAAAAGRVSAAPVVSAIDVPPFARAAMDGYAVRATDTAAAADDRLVRLRIVDAAFAGRPAAAPVDTGAAIAITTGAVIPDGADAVVMIEDTTREGDVACVRRSSAPGQHITRRGSDVTSGTTIAEVGACLTPARLGVLAAIGCADVEVFVRPEVAILSTGDEVQPPGAVLGPGQIFDVNTTTLAALVEQHGGRARVLPGAGDDRAGIERALRAALDADLVLVSGGSSVGERDFSRDVLAAHGTLVFEGLAIKPGKPTLLAVIERTPVVGMPGNPTSCLTVAHLIVVPLLRRLARLPPYAPRTVRARLARAVISPAERHQFYTVRVEGETAVPAFKGSGEITSMAQADGYFEIPAGCERVDAGESVTVILW